MQHHHQHLRLALWSGPFFLAMLLVFWGLIARSFPPIAADADAAVVATHFRANADAIRAGMLGSLTAMPFYLVWGIGLSGLMEKLDAPGHVMSRIQLGGAALTAVVFLLSFAIILFAAYRPEALEPATIQLLYDAGWIMLLATPTGTAVQMFAIGYLFLKDTRPQPLIPKWVCWYSIWVGFASLAENLLPFFRTGPFARQGLVSFWLQATIFFVFMAIVSFYALKAAARLRSEEGGA